MTSLNELVAVAGRALRDGRKLFGASPVNAGGWSSAPTLVAAGQGVRAAGRAAAAGWGGESAAAYGPRNASQVRALGDTVVADDRVGPAVTNAGHSAANGATRMDNLIAETRIGVGTFSGNLNSPAAQQQLATYLQDQLARANAILKTAQHDSHGLAVSIKNASAGYPQGDDPTAPTHKPATDGDQDREGINALDNHVRLVDSKGTSDQAGEPAVAIDPRNPFVGDERFGHWQQVVPPPYVGHHPPPPWTGHRPLQPPFDTGGPTGFYPPGGKTWADDNAPPFAHLEEQYKIRITGQDYTPYTRVVDGQQEQWVQYTYEAQRFTQVPIGGAIWAPFGPNEITGELGGVKTGGLAGINPPPNVGPWQPITLPQIASLSAANPTVQYYMPDGCGGQFTFTNGTATGGNSGLPPIIPSIIRG